MGTINKKECTFAAEAEWTINSDYNMTVKIAMKDLIHTSQTKFIEDAFATLLTAGYEIGAAADAPYGGNTIIGLGLQVTNIKISPINGSPSSAWAYIYYGTPAVELTTNQDVEPNWVWEFSSTTRTESTAYEIGDNGKKTGIVCKYYPDDNGNYWLSDKWLRPENQRRFAQTSTATKQRGWVNATCRARIRYDWIQRYLGYDLDTPGYAYNPMVWAYDLSGKVNDVIYNDGDRMIQTKGIWLCQGTTISSPNNGILWDVRVNFARNDYGWDPVIFYSDPNYGGKMPANIAKRITQQPKFCYPYPDMADRVLNQAPDDPAPLGLTDVGGARRPRMHELKNFLAPPYYIDLRLITGA